MAVQLAHSINLRRDYRMVEHYQPVQRSTSHRMRGNLHVINNNSDIAKSIVSQAAFQASLERMILQKKIWEDFLDKLRKGGGGGGSMRRLDRIAVSFMLMNYLSDKAIKAMLENLNLEFLKSQSMQNSGLVGTLRATSLLNATSVLRVTSVQFIIALIKNSGIQNIPKAFLAVKLQLSGLLAAFSFQLNKLKEVIEEELKEAIRKLDVKEKMKKIKERLADLFAGFKSYVLDVLENFWDFLNKIPLKI